MICEMRGGSLASSSGYGKEAVDLREAEVEVMESGD